MLKAIYIFQQSMGMLKAICNGEGGGHGEGQRHAAGDGADVWHAEGDVHDTSNEHGAGISCHNIQGEIQYFFNTINT